MHTAPAFTLPVRPDRRWQRGERALQGLATAALIGWGAQHALQNGEAIPALLGAVWVTILLVRRRRSTRQPPAPPPACLTWNGTADGCGWQLDARPVRVDGIVDLGHWLLLRCQPAADGRPLSPTVWLALARRDHAPQWHALRCALVSPGTAPDRTPER